MKDTKAIVTIVNSLSPTSMDFHEFVLYRVKHYPDELNYFMVLGPVDKNILQTCKMMVQDYPVYIYDCGGDCSAYLRRIDQVKQELINEKIPALMHVHMGRSGAIALLQNRFSKKSRIPALYTVHNTRKWATWKSELILPINILSADEVTVVSEYAFRSVPICWRWLKKGHIRPLVNGTNIDWIDSVLAEATLRKNTDSKFNDIFSIISVCRLSEAKNMSWLIRLMPSLPAHFHLRIIGDGPLRSNLEKLVHELHLESRVIFAGMISRKEVFQEMKKANLYVSCSLWEGLPISVIEAMATRTIVLLSDIGSHREIAKYGTSAFVLPLRPEKWIDQIRVISSMSEPERKEVGNQNREIIEKHFTLNRMHAQYNKIYEYLWGISSQRYNDQKR